MKKEIKMWREMFLNQHNHNVFEIEEIDQCEIIWNLFLNIPSSTIVKDGPEKILTQWYEYE